MNIRIVLFAAIMLLGSLTYFGYCQPPPPPPGGGHGGGGNQPPAGAPIGEGLTILITLSVAYASKKIHSVHKVKDGS